MLKKINQKGFGTIEVLILILVIGIILVILINGITTTAVVMQEVDEYERSKSLAKSYINLVAEKSKSKAFYNNLYSGNFPPIPLTSEYTDSGNFSIITENDYLEDNNLKLTMTYYKSSSTSFDNPLIIISTILEEPKGY